MTRSRADDDKRSRQSPTILLAADDKHSILAEVAANQTRSIAYSAYGQQAAQQAITTRLGFNGELREARLGWYFLGKGYRVYNPILMRFHSPDSLSPFGRGGLNAYMYCAGDPVNFSDPTGHIGWLNRIFSRRLTTASSTSSLTTLIPEANSGNEHGLPPAQRSHTPLNIRASDQENIPLQQINVAQPPEPSPPPRPPKQKLRFQDSGGVVGMISPNWNNGEPERYRVIWKSNPSVPAPVPPPRVLAPGYTREFKVTYDHSGKPTQHSEDTVDLSLVNAAVRKT